MEWVKKCLAKEGACSQAPVLARAKSAFHSSFVFLRIKQNLLDCPWSYQQMGQFCLQQEFFWFLNYSGLGTGRHKFSWKRQWGVEMLQGINKQSSLLQKAAKCFLKICLDSGGMVIVVKGPKMGIGSGWIKCCLTQYIMLPFIKVPAVFSC